MIHNDTKVSFQLCLYVGETHLEGEWQAMVPQQLYFEVVERNPRMDQAAWGSYVRHNGLFQRVFDEFGALLGEEFLFSNDAIMMYSPLLPEE